MTIQTTPAPARSDVAATLGTTPAPVTKSTGADAAVARPFLRHGAMLTVGAAAWSATIFAFTPNPHDTVPLALYGVASGAFQVGLLCLLRVLWRTRALGEGRLARAALRFEAGLITLAIASTFVDAIQVSDLDEPMWLALDAFWPISMLGMFLIGIRIAVAGRWTGVSRFWPMVAESWAVVTVPTMGIFGMDAATVVGGLHLLVGYAVLGVIVSRKP